MKKLWIILPLILFVACSGTPVKSSNPAFLSGSAPSGVSADEIQSNLTRGTNNWGYFDVEVYVMTRPYVEADERERGKRNLSAEAEIEQSVKKSINDIVTRRTCFLVSLGANTLESARARNFVAKVEDSAGKLYPLSWLNKNGVESVPHYTGTTLSSPYTWHHSDVGCTATAVDLSKPFKLHVIPQLGGPPAILGWDIAQSNG